jgi:hypothetical protein
MELTRKTKLRISNSNNILRYENNYTLNIEKSVFSEDTVESPTVSSLTYVNGICGKYHPTASQ